MFHVIIAGGSGTRFWPWSTDKQPKQLLKVYQDKTMIRHTVNRIKEIDEANKIFVVANRDLLDKIKIEIPEVPKQNFIIEPSARNTAPAIGLCAMHLSKLNSNEIMAIYPSDHYISGEGFKSTIEAASMFARENAGLITIGINPTYPATGYGYININSKVSNKSNVFEVNKFIEKPNREKAKMLINEGQNFWNSGIFVWSIQSIISSIGKYMPNLHQSLFDIYNHIGEVSYEEKLNLYWNDINSESIDYGILEKESDIFLIPAEFTWSDLGNWQSLYNLLVESGDHTLKGNIVSIDSSNNLIISPKRLTATIGLENMVVINLNNTTLIMPIEQSEKVKDILSKLKN